MEWTPRLPWDDVPATVRAVVEERLGGRVVSAEATVGGFSAGFVILRGIVFYLRHQQAEGALVEEEPLVSTTEGDVLPNALPPEPGPNVAHETGIIAGAPDPFATFLSMQSLKEMHDHKKPTEQASS